MKHKDRWAPGKYVQTRKGLQASRNPAVVIRGSRLMADAQARMYEHALREHAAGLLLDLGCGEVPLYGVYRDLVTDSICVDWSESVHDISHVDCVCDLNGPLPLPDEYFDTILLTDVLEHVADPLHVWKEMSRVLKKGGKVIIGVPFLYLIHEAPHDYFRYTEFALRRFCEQAGMKDISMETYGGIAAVLADAMARAVSRSAWLSVLARGAGWILIHSPFGRISAARTARSFPLAYCLVAQKPQ